MRPFALLTTGVIALGGLAALSGAGPAHAAQQTFSNATTITINDQATATSAVQVPLSGGAITDVDVTITDVTHPYGIDIDLYLRPPGDDNIAVQLMSDACGESSLSEVTLTFDDEAAGTLPGSNCGSGTYRTSNTNLGGPDNVPVGLTVYPTLAALDGRNPVGEWTLYVVDDLAGGAGSIGGGFSIDIETEPVAIQIPTDGAATPYPFEIQVSGTTGTLNDVDVRLNGVTHSRPTDLDVLVVSPSGQSTLLMSDACGTSSIDNATLTFDDDAFAPLANSVPCSSGTFRPGNFLPNPDTFDEPAPAGPYGATLSALNGSAANGVWKVFVTDDEASAGGYITSVDLILDFPTDRHDVFTNSATIPLLDNGLVTASVEVPRFGGRITDVDLTIRGLSHSSQADLDLYLQAPGDDHVAVKLMSDVCADTGFSQSTIEFNDEASSSLSPTFCPEGKYMPTDADESDNVPEGLTVLPTLAAFDGRNPVGTWTLHVVDDTANGSVGVIEHGFSLDLQSGPAALRIPTSGAVTPYPLTRTVTTPGNITDIDVRLTGLAHTSPSDLDVLLVAPSGRRVLLMSDACGTGDVTGATFRFNDAATTKLPTSGTCTSGSYRPTNYGAADAFGTPAPAAPYAATLRSLNGTRAQGTWQVYVTDDTDGDGGYLTSVDLIIRTDAPPTRPTAQGTRRLSSSRADITHTLSTAWTAPVTGYVATCRNAAGHTVTGSGVRTSRHIVVSNLRRGKAYTCRVAATSSVGRSPWSNAVTVRASP